jgi:hypothetical protein
VKHDLHNDNSALYDEGVSASDLFADAAISFIERRSGDGVPWLAYVPFNAPHFPVPTRNGMENPTLIRLRIGRSVRIRDQKLSTLATIPVSCATTTRQLSTDMTVEQGPVTYSRFPEPLVMEQLLLVRGNFDHGPTWPSA